MPDLNTSVPGASLKLTQEKIQSIRDTWRAAGGVAYSAPTGQMCAMAEPKLLAFLAQFISAEVPPPRDEQLRQQLNDERRIEPPDEDDEPAAGDAVAQAVPAAKAGAKKASAK